MKKILDPRCWVIHPHFWIHGYKLGPASNYEGGHGCVILKEWRKKGKRPALLPGIYLVGQGKWINPLRHWVRLLLHEFLHIHLYDLMLASLSGPIDGRYDEHYVIDHLI